MAERYKTGHLFIDLDAGAMSRLERLLDDAVNKWDFEAVKSLIRKGANYNYRDAFGCNALMNASWVGARDIVEYLLEIGADTEITNNDGETALDMVKSIGHDEYGHSEIISILESHMKR